MTCIFMSRRCFIPRIYSVRDIHRLVRRMPICRFYPANLLKAFRDYGVTCAMMAPTMVILTLQEADFGSYDLRPGSAMCRSSPMAVEWIRLTMEAFPTANIQQGGLTKPPDPDDTDEDVHRQVSKRVNTT